MTPRVAIFCGSRELDDFDLVRGVMVSLYQPGDLVITGGQRGADKLAERAAEKLGIACEVFPAENYGLWPACGPKRNAAMLRRLLELRDAGCAVTVHAFPHADPTKRRGTNNMIGQVRRAGVEVREHFR